MNAHAESGVEGNYMDSMHPSWFAEQNVHPKEIDSEIWTILTAKCEGEAMARVRSAGQGNGMEGYIRLYKWYLGTTGLAITKRMSAYVSPGTPAKESQLADAIDRWIEEGRVLESMGDKYRLSEEWKSTAIERIMDVWQA